MRKEHLIQKIAEEVGLSKAEVNATLNTLVEVIYRETSHGGSVRLHKLGTFKGKKKQARLIYNPHNNRTYIHQVSMIPKFEAAQNFRDYLAKKDV